MKRIKFKLLLLFTSLILFLASCQTELEKYYQTPDWLKGNAWQVLEQKGGFSMFLNAVERSSYLDLVKGKGIITVMAPTDSAFQVFLTKKGYASVESIPLSEIDKIVGYHLVYYSFTKDAFEDYKPGGSSSENKLKGIYYKFRTKSREDITTEYDPANNNAPRKVIHQERFLPIFSHNFFESYQIESKSNYEFFYPNSNWKVTKGFNVSNASVKEYAIVTDNGYVYVIDQVLEPLETIYNTLRKNQNFELFRKAYDRFVSFTYDPTSSIEYGKGDSLYIMTHGNELPPIASEWPVQDYKQLALLSYAAYNLFAPDNASMQAFFNQYWSGYYKSLDDVNFEPLLALLLNHFYSGSTIQFPQQIEAGKLKSAYGTTIQFNRNDASVKSICVNGSFYGLNKLLVPPMFERVTAPMYRNPRYNIFLDMAKNAGFVQTLISDANNFKVFYPTDSMILLNTNLEGKSIFYQNLNPQKYGAQEVQIDGDNGPIAMSVNQKKAFSGGHVATRLITSKGDEAIYATLNSYNYLYVKGNKVYSSAIYNMGAPAKVPQLTLLGSWPNGQAYALTGENASALVPEYNQFKNMITSVASPVEFNYFKNTVQAGGMDKTSPPFNFLLGERFIAFIPKDDAIYAGWMNGSVPVTPATAVVNYLKRYFVNVTSSGLLDYPFSGTGIQTTINTFAVDSKGATVKFSLIDQDNQLYIKDGKGKMVKVLQFFPYIYADGAAYLIDGLLETE